MEVHAKITLLILLYAISCNAISQTTREVRTLLPEKIIGGVMDIVHSHKYKPVNQPAYQQMPQGYAQQYPQYQQWGGQSNYQNQGYQAQYPGQFQGQTQYSYAPQNGYQVPNYPQNGGSFSGSSGQMYPTGQGFSNAQNGQYQPNYQQPNGQYQQAQGSGQYNGQYYGQGGQTQGFQTSGTGQYGGGQGFQVPGGSQMSGSGSGPTCVCQTWTKKPLSELMKDSPEPEKYEKIQDTERSN